MSDQREEMVSALQDEVLSEMAETFFSARKAVDEEIELYRSREEELRRAAQRALCHADWLADLLAGPDMAEQMWRALGVHVDFMRLTDGGGRCPHRDMPFAWTRRGLYEKLLLEVYADVWRAFDDYINGAAATVPGRPGKVRKLGRRRYSQWAAEINRMVDKANRDHSPSCVLGMARALDVEGQEKLRVAGSGMQGYSCALDATLALPRLDENVPELPDLPELPPPDVAERTLRAFARRVWRERRKQAAEALARVESAQE
ncbi:MAG TPA: hypothetical protein VE028_02890 [Nitratidesulfovibrio sp.]|nr:hypothetical protein [Nitratidesulfovibrio sp.]